MSFFGQKATAQNVNPQAVAQAEGELEMIMDLFQKYALLPLALPLPPPAYFTRTLPAF